MRLSVELSILNLFCKDRHALEVNYGYIKETKNLEKEIRLLFRLVYDFYGRYQDADDIKSHELKAFFDFQYPQSPQRLTYLALIDESFALDVKPSLTQDLLEQMVERHFAARIVNKLIPVTEGSKVGIVADLHKDVEEFHSIMANPPIDDDHLVPCEMTLEEMIAEENVEDGLTWHLQSITDTLGKARRKTLGLVYAFVDSGKSSFALATAAGFAAQIANTDEYIVYAGNEEAAGRSRYRLTQAITQKTKTEIANDPTAIKQELAEKGFERVKLFDSVNRIDDVRRLLDKWRPIVMFIDQATKVDMASQDKEVTAIRKLFNTYRELAKEYDTTIIGVTQGVGDAENKKWLKLSDIYGSRVAIQGELDYAIGIGRLVDDASQEHTRFINIPKNKLHDGEGAKIVVNFRKEKCLWRPI
jgi:hypothetical protein